MEYSQSYRIAQAAEDFAISREHGYTALTDKTLFYYIDKYKIEVDDDVYTYAKAVREGKIPPIEEIPAQDFVAEIDKIGEKTPTAFLPIIEKITKNIFLFSPEYDTTRQTIINDFWDSNIPKNLQSDDKKDLIISYLSLYANEILVDFPKKFAAEQKLPETDSLNLIYAGKQLYETAGEKFVEDLYNSLLLVHKVDKLKKKINPFNHNRIDISNNRLFDICEQESASADRCF